MNQQSFPAEITEFISQVVRKGSTYQIEAMEELYTPDQALLYFGRDGTVQRSTRVQMIEEFKARRDSGEPYLLMEYKILHVEQQGDSAVALVYRRMGLTTPPFLYELRLRRDSGAWMVSGETVTPWPGSAVMGSFLPTRQHAAIQAS